MMCRISRHEGMLHRISRHNKFPPSRVTGRTPVSIESATCPGRLWVASMIPQPSSMSFRLQSARMPVLFSEGFLGVLTLLAT